MTAGGGSCCWAGGMCFQLLRCWSGGAGQGGQLAAECGSAEQAPPGDRAGGECVTPIRALVAAVVAP